MNEFKIDNKNKITSGFIAPEGFFDNFTIPLNREINQQNTIVKVISINSKRWITSVAAVLIVALSITIYSKMAVIHLEDNTIENYLTSQSEISQFDLINLLDKKDIEDLSLELNLYNTKIDEDFTNRIEIENYLTEIN
jgi:hypothetical protein